VKQRVDHTGLCPQIREWGACLACQDAGLAPKKARQKGRKKKKTRVGVENIPKLTMRTKGRMFTKGRVGGETGKKKGNQKSED